MSERRVSVIVVASVVLWIISCGLMIGGLWDLRFMGWGLWLSAIGATVTIRQMLVQSEAKMRNAFELGRDYEREGSSVRSLR